MNYKFVDIGTCFYATSIDEFGLNVNGLLVEPITKFLNTIPSSPTIYKENSAISNFDGVTDINIYFTKEDLENANLEYFSATKREELRRKKKFADFIKNMLPAAAISAIKARDNWITTKPPTATPYQINCITFDTLIKKYDIEYIEFLRIDTEGHEPIVLEQIYNSISSNKIVIDNIQYERDRHNLFGVNEELDIISKQFVELGYSVSRSQKDGDIILSK